MNPETATYKVIISLIHAYREYWDSDEPGGQA